MSKFRKTLKSKYYWTAKGQGRIYGMLKNEVNERGDSAKLAKKIGSTPGYVSQILNGDTEINPTWKKIVKFCLALDKVPVLEIKDMEDYLFEENLKASYSKYDKLFQESCQIIETEKISELNSSSHIELNDLTFLIQAKNKRNTNSELFEYKYDEYELV